LTVTASQNLAGVALEHNTQEDHATVLQATRGFTTGDGDTTLNAPINKNNYYGRFTGIQVQNISGRAVDMYVNYVENYEIATQHTPGCPGGTASDHALNVPDGTSHTFSSNGLHNGCFASATITASGKVVAIVNEEFTSNYLSSNPGHAEEDTSYAALRDLSATANLSAPLFKEDSYGNGTGLSIENVGTVDATNVVIILKGPTGTYKSNSISSSHGKAYVAFDLRLKPGSFWHGTPLTPTALGCQNNTTGCGTNGVFSVIVNSDQKIVAIANEAAYPPLTPLIPMDESNYEAFNLP
jgi:hypothetical protein